MIIMKNDQRENVINEAYAIEIKWNNNENNDEMNNK